jgi:hypothetical protein
MVVDLFRGVRHLGPQYLADNIWEAEWACLGYRSRLYIPDPALAIVFLTDIHLATQDPKQENNQRTPGRSQVPQIDPPATRLHNSDNG